MIVTDFVVTTYPSCTELRRFAYNLKEGIVKKSLKLEGLTVEHRGFSPNRFGPCLGIVIGRKLAIQCPFARARQRCAVGFKIHRPCFSKN